MPDNLHDQTQNQRFSYPLICGDITSHVARSLILLLYLDYQNSDALYLGSRYLAMSESEQSAGYQ